MPHLQMAREYAGNPDAWALAPRFDPVQRWYHRLALHAGDGGAGDGGGAGDAEVWLLTWLPGQGTDLHDHGGSAGAFVVVSGVLTEETVAEDPGRASFAAGQGRAFGGEHVHRIVNEGPRPAVSVHVYGPALKTMRRYRIENETLVVATVETAGVNW